MRLDAEMALHDMAMTRFGNGGDERSGPATPTPKGWPRTAALPSATSSANT